MRIIKQHPELFDSEKIPRASTRETTCAVGHERIHVVDHDGPSACRMHLQGPENISCFAQNTIQGVIGSICGFCCSFGALEG